MGGTKRQREEYEEFLINRPPVHMNADTQANILAMTVEATQLEVERARMQLEDQQAKVNEATEKLMEEVSFIHSKLYSQRFKQPLMYLAACEAMEILDPNDPLNWEGAVRS